LATFAKLKLEINMRRYLVPIGEAKHSASTLQFAIDVAKDVGAELFVTKIFTPPSKAGAMAKLGRVIEEDMRDELDNILSEVDTKGVKISAKPIKGRVEESIERLGKRIDAHLIILSSTTAERNPEIYLGKTSGALVKHTDLPILIVPPSYQYRPLKKVLFGFRSGVLKKESVKGSVKILSDVIKAKIFPLQVIIPKMVEEDKVISTTLLMKSEAPKIVESETLLSGVKAELSNDDYDLVCVVRRKAGFFKRLWQDTRITKKDFDPQLPLLVLS